MEFYPELVVGEIPGQLGRGKMLRDDFTAANNRSAGDREATGENNLYTVIPGNVDH